MSRLTKRIIFPDGTCTYDFSNERIGEFLTDHNAGVKALFEELCKFEDAREQGLFLILPCKVGDIAWVIDEDFECSGKKKIYEAKWTRVTLVQSKTNGLFELHGEVSYQVYDFFYNDGRTMPHAMYVGQHNTKFGEVVFLSKEEAELNLNCK